MNYKLSPSDFAFLWEECRRCFYLKVVRNYPRPRPIMPKIFNVIDAEMERFFSGRRTEEVIPSLPAGVVEYGEKWVQSTPISFPGKKATCYIKGKFDTVVKFDDGSYGVIDFKTSERNAEHIPLYSRQLHAYAYALENATPGELSLSPISKLGLLVYEPRVFSTSDSSSASLEGGLVWIEVPRDNGKFLNFLERVVFILDRKSVV